MSRGVIMAALGAVAVGAAVALRHAGERVPESSGNALVLSPRRVAALAAVASVVPSAYPSQKFAQLAPGYSLAILIKYPTFSTCGYLPAFVARRLGATGKLLLAGIEGLRAEAKAHGAWRTPINGLLPKPGDFYGLADTKDGGLVHVGVVKSASDLEWVTADAGQGPLTAQRADYVRRSYDPKDGSIHAAAVRKFAAGWLDLDVYPFPS